MYDYGISTKITPCIYRLEAETTGMNKNKHSHKKEADKVCIWRLAWFRVKLLINDRAVMPGGPAGAFIHSNKSKFMGLPYL